MTVQSSGEAGSRAASRWPLPGRVRSIPWNQDARAVKDLRLGAGVIGAFLPIMLIVWNWIAGDKTIVPTSMSGSYYTSSRNLFVGSLYALGVFLILYRHTILQNLCTWCAGAFALLVAFASTTSAPPATEGRGSTTCTTPQRAPWNELASSQVSAASRHGRVWRGAGRRRQSMPASGGPIPSTEMIDCVPPPGRY